MIRTHDHAPPHIHAESGSGKTAGHARIDLQSLEIDQVRNCSMKELRLVVAAVIQHQEELIEVWELCHGK